MVTVSVIYVFANLETLKKMKVEQYSANSALVLDNASARPGSVESSLKMACDGAATNDFGRLFHVLMNLWG